jgi:hypothetical protein
MKQVTTPYAGDIRMEIFGCLLSLRARADYHLGFLQDEETSHVHFSPYVVCERRAAGPTAPSTTQPPTEKGETRKSTGTLAIHFGAQSMFDQQIKFRIRVHDFKTSSENICFKNSFNC